MNRARAARRAPGRENGDPFIRRCPVCRRETKARGLPDREKVRLAASFAVVHREHFEHVNPDEDPCRCRVCGLMLLFDHRCPAHVYEERVPWTAELDQAYREVVEAVAKGGARTVLPWGKPEYVVAYNLARLWGMRADVLAPGGFAA